MTTLAEVRRVYWCDIDQDQNERSPGPLADEAFVLATDYDALQAECEALKQAIREAGPAIEAGAGFVMSHAAYRRAMSEHERADELVKQSDQLRALAEIVK